VIGRVPVLGEDDMREKRSDATDGLDDGIAIGNCESAAGTKIVLDVDDY
jgi:hypothetical protein